MLALSLASCLLSGNFTGFHTLSLNATADDLALASILFSVNR